MYNAPAVTYPVGRSRIQEGLTVGLLILAAGALGLWMHQLGRLAWPQGLGVAVWVMVAAFAWHGAVHPVSGSLVWDGREWHWAASGDAVAVAVRPHLDGQSWVLLALRPQGQRTLWLWLSRDADGLHWDALRRALWGQGGAEFAGRHAGGALDQP